jgi:hypothetical protein
MEARAELREPRISKGLVAVVLVGVTLGLGVMAGTMAKNLSAPAPATKAHAIVQGNGGPAVLTIRGHGTQIVDRISAPASTAAGYDDRKTTTSLAPNSFLGPDAQERNAQLAPNSFLGPDAQERNAKLAAPSAAVATHRASLGNRAI